MAKTLGILPKLKAKGNFAVQGELVGPGIQANKLGLADKDFYAFNVYDIDNKKYLDFNDFVNFCADVGVKTVPILMKDVPFAYSKDELLALAEGKYDGTTNEREGLVIRPMVEMRSEVLKGRMSVKAISNAFLLKNKE
jgi:RNA ligase (TIGR02306 family)